MTTPVARADSLPSFATDVLSLATMKSHQRKIRDIEQALIEPRPVDAKLDYTVEPITLAEARDFITRYEWLGTVGNPVARYCARNLSGELVAVALFGKTGGNEARSSICGPEHAAKAICYERGACAHWAHPHTASWFIPRACKMAARDHGYRIFYAYADPQAGEIGTVYQAAGWYYLGQGVGRDRGRGRDYFRHPEHTGQRWITEKALRTRRGISIADALANGWQRQSRPAKHKYVHLEGSKAERRALRRAMADHWLLSSRGDRHIAGPYPKRALP